MNLRRYLGRFVGVMIVIGILGVAMTGYVVWRQFSRPTAIEKQVERDVRAYRFDLFSYEVASIASKTRDLYSRWQSRLHPGQARRLVQQYNWRARRIGSLDDEIKRIYADPNVEDPDSITAAKRATLARMRALQAEGAPIVEAVLQQQVTAALADHGLTTGGVVLPPVRFRFTEPPNFLVVSPRHRIEFEAGVELRANLDPAEVVRLEDQVAQRYDRSTLIEGVGGLGAWPTLVLDDASLSWVLSTIAHEWLHNYLATHPLGWHMFDSPQMNTINETVATIAGDELGNGIAQAIYGIAPPPPSDHSAPPAQQEPDPFNFGAEMRKTRLHVDELLAAGKVQEAEQYMEQRRLVFVEQGYALRKLNQAYFAFHGTYATTPAASDPIGPKLRKLRQLSPNLQVFLSQVAAINRPEDLDRLLEIGQK